MSIYTDSASRPGQRALTGDDRALFLSKAGPMVIESYKEAMDFLTHRYIITTTGQKSAQFPIVGRKRDATEHEAGEMILGGKIEHNDITITVDKFLVDSVFIPEQDELLNYFSVVEPYSRQIGASIGTANDKRIAIMHVLASRVTAVAQGQPTPGYFWDANLKTSGQALENFAAAAQRYLLENDNTGEKFEFFLPFAQVLLLARYTGVEGSPVTTGSGNRAEGTIGKMMGLQPKGTNHLPSTNITTGNAKYQGDFSKTVGVISSKHAVGSIEVRGMRLVLKDFEERLGMLMIGSQLSGHGILRPECSIEGRTEAIAGRTPIPNA